MNLIKKYILVSVLVLACALLFVSYKAEEDYSQRTLSPDEIKLAEMVSDPTKFDVQTRNGFFALATSVSVQQDHVEISDCNASPFVLEINNGQEITVNNLGQEDIHLNINGDLEIPAKGSVKFIADFQDPLLLAAYKCEGVDFFAGFLLVNP